MHKEFLPLVLLIGVMVISGCIGQEARGIKATDGLVITDFSFDYATAYMGETRGLHLEVQNVGGETGILKKISLFGPEINDGVASDLVWGLIDGVKVKTITTADGTLYPPDPDTDFEGDFYPYDWELEAPTNIKSEFIDDFRTRIEYEYKTTLTGTLLLVKRDYLNTLPAEEREALIEKGGVIESDVTGGPLRVFAAKGRHFIISDDTNLTARNIRFKITNVGSGFPYGQNITDNLYEIKNVQWNNLDSCDITPLPRLSSGETGRLKCQFTPTTGFINRLEKRFTITITYNYYTGSAASITVKPIFEA